MHVRAVSHEGDSVFLRGLGIDLYVTANVTLAAGTVHPVSRLQKPPLWLWTNELQLRL
ncbi:MAG: hypothetical protein ACI8W3_001324 [Myxococcota bacterium]|jgi:hypothetical protein